MRLIDPNDTASVEAALLSSVPVEWAALAQRMSGFAEWQCGSREPLANDGLRELSMRLHYQVGAVEIVPSLDRPHQEAGATKVSMPPWTSFAMATANDAVEHSRGAFISWHDSLCRLRGSVEDAGDGGDVIREEDVPVKGSLLPVAGATPLRGEGGREGGGACVETRTASIVHTRLSHDSLIVHTSDVVRVSANLAGCFNSWCIHAAQRSCFRSGAVIPVHNGVEWVPMPNIGVEMKWVPKHAIAACDNLKLYVFACVEDRPTFLEKVRPATRRIVPWLESVRCAHHAMC